MGEFGYPVLQVSCTVGPKRPVYSSGIVISAICIVNPLKRNLLENAIGVERRESQLLAPNSIESSILSTQPIKGDTGYARVSKPLVVKPAINTKEMDLVWLVQIHEVRQHAVECRQKDRIVRALLSDIYDHLTPILASRLSGFL